MEFMSRRYPYYNLKTSVGNGALTIGARTNGAWSVKGEVKFIQVRDVRVPPLLRGQEHFSSKSFSNRERNYEP